MRPRSSKLIVTGWRMFGSLATSCTSKPSATRIRLIASCGEGAAHAMEPNGKQESVKTRKLRMAAFCRDSTLRANKLDRLRRSWIDQSRDGCLLQRVIRKPARLGVEGPRSISAVRKGDCQTEMKLKHSVNMSRVVLRVSFFALALLSFAFLLGQFFGWWTMPLFGCWFLIPATAMLTAVAY